MRDYPRIGLLICTVYSCLTSQAFGRFDQVPGSRYTSARGAALGDAYLPIADDTASALFYNPAAIGKLKEGAIEPFTTGIYVNSDYIKGLNHNFYKAPFLNQYASNVKGNPGPYPGVGGYLVPTWGARGFAIGLLLQSEMAAKSTSKVIRYRSNYMLIPAFGFGLRFWGGIFRVGYSLQWVNKTTADREVPVTDTDYGYTKGAKQGSALSHTLGLSLVFPIAFLPSFQIVARNLATTKYIGVSLLPLATSTAGAPSNEVMSIDAAFGMVLKTGNGTQLNLAVEYRDALNSSSTLLMSRAVAGVEFVARDTFFLRGGWGSAYPSAGFGFKRPKADISFSWYSEETGKGYHSERDIKYLMQYQVKIF